MATHDILWCFGASEQDAGENVLLNSEETVAAVEYGVRLFREVMNPAILSWNAASNNQALNARQTSYILNSISAIAPRRTTSCRWQMTSFSFPRSRGRGGPDGRAST